MKQDLPPIAVFAYNRPRHLRMCLEALERSQAFSGQKYSLTIYCDAPRKEKDVPKVTETQNVAKSWKGASVVIRPHNHGFANITEGISEKCRSEGRVIVVEDDLIVAPDFLPFISGGMERYKNDPNVFMISGFMYQGMENHPQSSFFLRSSFIWGWGTWERAWRHFDWKPSGWENLLKERKSRSLFDFYGSFPFSKCLRKTMTGQWVTWDLQWMYTHFSKGGHALYPSRSLVWNCGVGGGVHGKETGDVDPRLAGREFYLHGTEQIEDFFKPRLNQELLLHGKTFPHRVECDKKAMRQLATIFLQERIRKKERKKWRLYLKLWLQTLKHALTSK